MILSSNYSCEYPNHVILFEGSFRPDSPILDLSGISSSIKTAVIFSFILKYFDTVTNNLKPSALKRFLFLISMFDSF